jgi:medium-chain acyl-[acyl-carrier-protein] hydrolase
LYRPPSEAILTGAFFKKTTIMSGTPFDHTYRIRYFETGRSQELSITSLMRYFEELALFQSEANGVGFDYYHRHQVIWMLHQYDIRIHRMPRFGDTVLLRTIPESIYRFMGFRRFWVLNQEGEELVSADSSWLYVNTQTRRPIRVSEDMKRAYGHLDKPESRLNMEEMPALERIDHEKEFQVRQSDIDVNQHVNHVQYVEWALEALPPEILLPNRMSRVQVAFKKETVYGQRIRTRAEVREGKGGLQCLHAIIGDDGEEKSALRTFWNNV